MIDLKFKMEVREFNQYLGELAKEAKGATFRQVIQGEAGSILGMAAQKTGVAKIKDINRRYKIVSRQRKHMPEHMRTRKRDKSGQWTKKPGQVTGSRVPQDPKLIKVIKIDGKNYFTKNYYPDRIFKKMKAALKERLAEAKKRRMSGRATWYLIAKKCGAPTRTFKTLAGIQKAIRAQSQNYKSDQVENGTEINKTFSYSIKIFNGANCCLNKSARGSFAIRSAMAGRPKQFKGNVRRKVFDDAKKRAKQYPNIYVTD